MASVLLLHSHLKKKNNKNRNTITKYNHVQIPKVNELSITQLRAILSVKINTFKSSSKYISG